MKNENTVLKETIEKLYFEEELTIREISKILNVPFTSLRRIMKNYEITSRTNRESRGTTSYKIKSKTLGEKYKKEYTQKTTKNCPICNKDFFVTGKTKGKKYCSKECVSLSRKKLEKQICYVCGEEIKITNKRSYKRKYCSECNLKRLQEKEKIRTERECSYCGKKLLVIKSRSKRKRLYCDVSCMAKEYSRSKRYEGKNNPVWSGGKKHYKGGWNKARIIVLERDEHSCKLCGVSEKEMGREMDVHHIKNYKKYKSKVCANKPKNLICLCHNCHRFVHSKKNTDKIFIKN